MMPRLQNVQLAGLVILNATLYSGYVLDKIWIKCLFKERYDLVPDAVALYGDVAV